MRDFRQTVSSGKNGFDAKSESVADLSAFQPLAKLAEEAYDAGYINFFKPHQEAYSGHRFIDAFLAGELTDHGQEFIGAP